MRKLVAIGVLGIIGCGGGAEPPKTTATAATPVEPVTDGGASTAAAPVDTAPAKRPRKPFEIHNTCTDVATVVFGDNPKAPGVYERKLAPSTTGEGPRDDEGNQTVWLLDPNGEPLVKVRVTRGMKKVEVGRSCRTLDAH